MRKSPPRVAAVPLIVTSLFLSSCTRTVEHKVARVSAGTALGPTTRPAPESAVYKVKVRRESEDEYHSVPGTASIVRRGDTLGFEFDEYGNAYAVAGPSTFPIELPPDWRRLTWYASYGEPTRFGRDLNRGSEAVVRGAVVGAVWLGKEMLESDDDDDSEGARMLRQLREVERRKERRRRDRD